MVRETRHLWVGNLPENIREDRIREHFKRYGRVQSVKLLPRGEECPVDGSSGGSTGEGSEVGAGVGSVSVGGGASTITGSASATVAFMDIKSAAKAHATEHTLDERALTTQYYEPQHLQHRFPAHGSSEDHGSVVGVGVVGVGAVGAGVGVGVAERGVSEAFESRVSHSSFYGGDRVARVVEHSADPSTVDPGGYIPRGRPTPVGGYHVTSTRARDRLYPRTGPYATGPPPPPHLERHRASIPPSSWSSYEPASSRYASVPPPPSPATTDAYQEESGVGGGGNSGVGGGSAGVGALRQHKKQRRKSRSGSSSPSGSSRSGSSSSRSSRSGSSGGSTSGGSSSPGSSPHRTSNAAVTEDRRPLAICVRNLPARSSDTSLKDGLFHEYKKHGKVTWVKVVGAAGDRYALVCFKKPEDVEKALEVSHDKLFFGCKIEVAPYQGYDVEDNEFRPYEAELDEYHPKATRTLFIGNLEKDVTASELRKHFEPFGEIIEIDIKKQGAVSSSYAFCQYSDIGSVVKAMRSMDGEHLGSNRIKLGFGKSMPTSCVWVDGIGDCVSEKYINMQFHQFGPITQVVVDRERGHALVFFEQISCAQAAVKEMRGAALRGRRLQVDFASRECQETFYEHLERQGVAGEKPWDTRPSPAAAFDVARERSFESAVTVPNAGSRFTRYETPPRARTASYSRTPGGGSTPGASPAHPTAMSRSSRRSYQTDPYYEGDYAEPTPRRFRSYDEFSQGSGASHDDYETSVINDGKINDDDLPPPPRRHAVQSVVTSVEPTAPPPLLLPPPDIRHLQKERVHLLEQLEECHSSGDEGFAPKKRPKLDVPTAILCEDDEPEIASLLVTSHSGRKGMDVRRVSDSKILVHHTARRGSCEGRAPGPCKRRRDTTSRHHEHHDGSRPGTPLVDERPENLVPSEPRRFRERSHEGPLSLPLPRFAAQMMNNNNTSSSINNNSGCPRPSSTSIAKVASPPCATSLPSVPSPRAAPQPPASPPPRHPSPSPTSSDSETAPQSPSLEERIRSLDEKYEKWSGSRALSAAGGDALAKLDATASERFRFRHKLLDLDLNEVQPSDIVKSVLAKRSVFDEDSKRLENFNEKYEPREFTGVTGVGTMGATSGGNLIAATAAGSCSGKVGLQYPFPSHPPVQLSSSAAPVVPSSSSTTSSTACTSTTSPATLSTATTTCTTLVTPSSKADPRTAVSHNCVHPTPTTPVTPGTSLKTPSPELPPVSLPIGPAGTVTAASTNHFAAGLTSASNTSASSNIHASVSPAQTSGSSTSRTTNVLPPVSSVNSSTISTATSFTSSSPSTVNSAITSTCTSVSAALAMVTTASPTITTITSAIGGTGSGNHHHGHHHHHQHHHHHHQTSGTTTLSSTSSSTSAPTSSVSSSVETSRARLKKDNAAAKESRESRESKDGKDRHVRGSKDCLRRSRKDEGTPEMEKNRRDREEERGTVIGNETPVEPEAHAKDTKEAKHERKEREDRERREKEERERQERRDKEERDRQERKEREERERREKDEERRERERLDKERQEKERREREERERERKEREELEARERERREKEKIERERKEREEKERQERREREERERKERESARLEREKQEKERQRKEREEQERREKEERERLEREKRREEKERMERERKREREERERLEREKRKEKEKEERERAEKEKREKEEKEKLERDKHEKEKRREREEQERREKEKAVEREKRRERDEKEKEKKDRDEVRRQQQQQHQQQQQPLENHVHLVSSTTQNQPQASPAPVTIKRRCSSQDALPEDDAKRMKISSEHRRDSKDRPRQNRRSEDRKHRNESHRTNRDSRESRESKDSTSSSIQTPENREIRENRENRESSQTRCDTTRESNREMKECRENRDVKESRENRENRENKESRDSIRDNRENRDNNRDGKDKQRSKRNRLERTEKEARERSPRVSHELDKEFLARLELSKRNDSSPPNNQISLGGHHQRESSQREHHREQSSMGMHSDQDDGNSSNHEMQVTRHPSNTDTDSDEPKKHSIFDIIDDEPAYISMYDKVKARSTKNMQKLQEEKRQVRLRDKFSQLKQRRARREEKKQSTSWDGDSVSSKALTEDEVTSESDSTRAKSLSRKGSRSRIHSDTSEEEESFNNKIHKIKTERFHESDMDLGFADTEEKQNPIDSSGINVANSVHNIKKESRSSDDEDRLQIEFSSNHPVVNNYQRDSRKKSHKKKEKRQKSSISSEESVNVKIESSDSVEHKNRMNSLSGTDCRMNHVNDATINSAMGTPTAASIECAEERMRQDKKQRSKKEKRRERNGEDKIKARRKRLNRQEARDSQRMEDIFGPLSDEVDESPTTTFFNRLGNMPSENNAYGSDSDGAPSPILDLDRVRRKAEKKRRHQPDDENSVDLVEAGREIEAKLLGLPVSPKQTSLPCVGEANDHDVFRFTDDNDSVEPSTPTTAPEKIKEKKKKRKKSKEERARKDHHHRHHHHDHHDENREEFDYLDYASSRASTPLARMTVSPLSQDALLSPIPKISTAMPSPAPIVTPAVVVSPVANKLDKKKEKFIPGFGAEIDETIHENAVKSISEPEEREIAARQSCVSREDAEVPAPPTPPPRTEDKPRVIISQEETEDAVAALLEETFGGSTEDFSYEGEEEEAEGENASAPPSDAPQEDVEEMQQAVESLNASTGDTDADLKPDTPQSEHDLQIDTDTEEDPNYETFDLTQPPKTPDIPSFYKAPAKTPATAPQTLIIAAEKPRENCAPSSNITSVAVTRPPSPPASVISHSWALTENKSRDAAVKQQFEAPEPEISASSGQERPSAIDSRASVSPPAQHPPPPPQYKQPILGPCSMPNITDTPKISAVSPRPPAPTVTTPASLYQRLPLSPQAQMVPLRQASPKMPCVSTTASSNVPGTVAPTCVQSLVQQSRNTSLNQLPPRAQQPLSPNGQWSRSPVVTPHLTHSAKQPSQPVRIPVSVPISAHRPVEVSSQHIYSTAASQQPVIQHAPGMRALAPNYPRSGLPPLTLNIPPRPYMPVPPLVTGIQTKNSRDAGSFGGKSVIETLIPVNPHASPQRHDEPKISPAIIPDSTSKASTSPKVPSPNQPPTYIPETAKIDISAGTSSPPSITKMSNTIDNSSLSPCNQKQQPSITAENCLLSPKLKQDVHANLHLLTTHAPRSATPSPVIVAHGQSHIVHKTVVHALVTPGAMPTVNQNLVKTVVPVVQPFSPITPIPVLAEKVQPIHCQASQVSVVNTPRQTPTTQGILLMKPHVPSTVTQSIITRVVTAEVPSLSTTVTTMTTPPMVEQAERQEPRFVEKKVDVENVQHATSIVQPMEIIPACVPSTQIKNISQQEEKKPVVEPQKCLPLLEETKPAVSEQDHPIGEKIDETKIKIEKIEPTENEFDAQPVASPPKPVEIPSGEIVPKIEPDLSPKPEPASHAIKQSDEEEDTVKERDDLDIEEESIEDCLREPSTDPLALDVAKDDPTDSKEDSDYWSAKEVNIESVIKKVDALCDVETNEIEANDADEDSQHEQETNGDPNDTSKGDTDCWPDSESTEGDSKKDYANHDDHDEGVETCEIESIRSRRGRSKNRRGAGSNRGGVTTRRGGKTAANMGHRRGGRTSRGGKHHAEKNKLPADVYEFHDDSEEDNAGRPRLILTIKSPGPNAIGPNAITGTPVAAVKEVPPEEFVSPASNTRKSRRLAEKDGSRSTVDDTIEDVVRGTPTNKGLMATGGVAGAHATRRSTRNNNNSGVRGVPPQTTSTPTTPTTTPTTTTATTTTTTAAAATATITVGSATATISTATTMMSPSTTTVTTTIASPSATTAPANQTMEPRKSPRVVRKSSRITCENNEDSSEEKGKDQDRETAQDNVASNKSELEIAALETNKTSEEKKIMPSIVGQQKSTHEPMTLIDPVTGMLIPMRESEEGQYIPVSTAAAAAAAAAQAAQNAIRNANEARAMTNISSQSQQHPRSRDGEITASTAQAEGKKESMIESSFSQSAKPQIVPSNSIPSQPSVITKPHSPVIQATSTVVIQSAVTPTTTAIMISTPSLVSGSTPTMTACLTQTTKPTSLKAHVLNASKLVNSTIQSQQAPSQIIPAKLPPSVIPSQPTGQNIVKQTIPSNPSVQGLRLQIPGGGGGTVPPSLSPRTKPINIGNGPNGKQGQPMSPVLNSAPGAPPNPKQHLLQAAKQQTPTIVNLPQKIPLSVHQANLATTPIQRIHNPIAQPTTLKGINGQPHLQSPKAHILQAVAPTIITGAVASPPNQPHIIAGQPVVVSGTVCPRPTNVSKPQLPGTMEPPKVEVSMSGCIMVPTASPQARGVPVVPAYEAPLHASAVAVPSPGGQYGLVPPHRSLSPPLPPPAHHHANASQSDVVNHYGGLSRAGELPPHYIHPQVLQYQYLRAQQEALTAPRIAYHVPGARSPHLPLDPKLDTIADDTHSPPLELRRGTRTPQDRTTDSPQVAQVYMMPSGARLPPPISQYSPAANPPLAGTPSVPRGGYYEPPPAHIRSQYPMAGSEAPTDRAITPERPRKHQVATPPHASQVPPQADSLLMLLQRYPVMWQGLLALKNDQAAVQMHFVFGNPNVARDSLPCNSDGSTPPLRIAQRMRLEQTQLDGVARKMQTDNEHCMLLALPCGRDHMDVLQQSKNLQTGFITYLQQKQAAGIVNIPGPVSQQPAYVVHIFPACDFANESLARIAPDLLHRVAEIAHLLIVIATV